jgi:hypothetical protein
MTRLVDVELDSKQFSAIRHPATPARLLLLTKSINNHHSVAQFIDLT